VHTPAKVLLAAALIGGSLLLPTVAQAGVQELSTIEVTKVVEGDVPEGTEFVVTIECDTGQPASTEFTFGAEGGSDSVELGDDNQCVVSETEDGGAESVTYAATCTGPCVADPPTADGVVIHLQQNGGVATVTVTNAFPEAAAPPEPPTEEPAPAPVVEAEADFTG
jgi:hypothetical protein